jgi:hypothetical protein
VDEHGVEQVLDVLGHDVASSREQRPCTSRALEREAPANRRPDRHGVGLARGADEVDDPTLDDRIDVDVLHGTAELLDLLEREHRLHVREWMAVPLLVQDLELVGRVGVAERRAQEEAIELRLRQRERPLVLDRVLGREQQERVRKDARDAVDRHLPLCHRFEQRRLRLRHRSVDLVDEHDVREDRPGAELEVTLPLVENGQARDIGRLEVRRALDPLRGRAVDRLRDRTREHRLRRSGHVFEEDVPAAHQRREHELDLCALAVDDELDVVEEAVGKRDRAREPLFVGRDPGSVACVGH